MQPRPVFLRVKFRLRAQFHIFRNGIFHPLTGRQHIQQEIEVLTSHLNLHLPALFRQIEHFNDFPPTFDIQNPRPAHLHPIEPEPSEVSPDLCLYINGLPRQRIVHLTRQCARREQNIILPKAGFQARPHLTGRLFFDGRPRNLSLETGF